MKLNNNVDLYEVKCVSMLTKVKFFVGCPLYSFLFNNIHFTLIYNVQKM